MTNWKTTLAGILVSVGSLLQAGEGNWSAFGTLMIAFGAFLGGAAARDFNVTSERAGAR